jgi:hypothetical protein
MEQIQSNTKEGNKSFTKGGIQRRRPRNRVATLKREWTATSKLTLKDPIGWGTQEAGREGQVELQAFYFFQQTLGLRAHG